MRREAKRNRSESDGDQAPPAKHQKAGKQVYSSHTSSSKRETCSSDVYGLDSNREAGSSVVFDSNRTVNSTTLENKPMSSKTDADSSDTSCGRDADDEAKQCKRRNRNKKNKLNHDKCKESAAILRVLPKSVHTLEIFAYFQWAVIKWDQFPQLFKLAPTSWKQ